MSPQIEPSRLDLLLLPGHALVPQPTTPHPSAVLPRVPIAVIEQPSTAASVGNHVNRTQPRTIGLTEHQASTFLAHVVGAPRIAMDPRAAVSNGRHVNIDSPPPPDPRRRLSVRIRRCSLGASQGGLTNRRLFTLPATAVHYSPQAPIYDFEFSPLPLWFELLHQSLHEC